MLITQRSLKYFYDLCSIYSSFVIIFYVYSNCRFFLYSIYNSLYFIVYSFVIGIFYFISSIFSSLIGGFYFFKFYFINLWFFFNYFFFLGVFFNFAKLLFYFFFNICVIYFFIWFIICIIYFFICFIYIILMAVFPLTLFPKAGYFPLIIQKFLYQLFLYFLCKFKWQKHNNHKFYFDIKSISIKIREIDRKIMFKISSQI